jgi:hypothetical protein
LAAVAKRWPAISPTSLAAISGPNPGLAEQLRRDLGNERGDLALEPVDRERELAQAAQLLARENPTTIVRGNRVTHTVYDVSR